jgi:hypothetical protein
VAEAGAAEDREIRGLGAPVSTSGPGQEAPAGLS